MEAIRLDAADVDALIRGLDLLLADLEGQEQQGGGARCCALITQAESLRGRLETAERAMAGLTP